MKIELDSPCPGVRVPEQVADSSGRTPLSRGWAVVVQSRCARLEDRQKMNSCVGAQRRGLRHV